MVRILTVMNPLQGSDVLARRFWTGGTLPSATDRLSSTRRGAVQSCCSNSVRFRLGVSVAGELEWCPREWCNPPEASDVWPYYFLNCLSAPRKFMA